MRAALTAWLSIAALAGAQGPTDLSEVLAQPLDAEFTEAGGANFLRGEFNAHQYAVWLAGSGSDIQPIEEFLRSEGFTRGYSKTWFEHVHVEVGVGESQLQYLTETVEEYASAGGAQGRLDSTRSYVQTEPHLEKAIATTIPGAWAAVIDAGYSTQYQVSFSKGNDVYFVMMDSAANDMTDEVLKQATSQYDAAPAETIPPTAANSGSPPIPTVARSLLVVGGVVIGAVVVITVLVLIVLIVTRAGRGGPQPVAPPGAQLSPDSDYWWDGASWQPTRPGPTSPV